MLPTAIVLASLLLGGAVYYSAAQKQAGEGATPTPTLTATPTEPLVTATVTATPTASPTVADSVLLRAAVLAKSGIPEAKFEFSIGSNSGVMARGSVRHTDDMGGAAWFAGKLNGVWKVSYIGQGVPLCAEIADFNYPTSWLSHCVNAQGNTVAR